MILHPPAPASRWLPPLLLLTTIVHATGAGELCTWELQPSYGKSYTPWFRGWKNVTSGFGTDDPWTVENMACWWYADCIFSNIPETRKQQYSAIGIVMALIPFMLKDIAWPHRRIVLSPKRHWVVETIVRALGLNPVDEPASDREEMENGRKFGSLVSAAIMVSLVVLLLLAYAMLTVMEVFSKRSSFGCPVPAFIVLWFIIALIPAAIEVGFSRFRVRRKRPSAMFPAPGLQTGDNVLRDWKEVNVRRSNFVASQGVQGGGQHWIVQFCWGIYYSAGGLIFTSIMLVSVLELFTWMFLAGFVTAAGKLLGYKLCGYWGTQ